MNDLLQHPTDALSETEVTSIKDFLKPYLTSHTVALHTYWDTGLWPEDFLPADVVIDDCWLEGLMAGMNYIWAPEYGHPKRFMDELVDAQNKIQRLLNEEKLKRVEGFRVLRTSDSILDQLFHRIASWVLQFKYKPDGLLIFVNQTPKKNTITYISVLDSENEE